ncbi:MAG: DMT family transporter [Lachnospiraceae bacterium]|nr:DMT family transporter [Lachnospiraceae bacterium]
MKKENIKGPALLLLTACIWGVAFVAQSVGMEYVGPFTFNFVRSILGGLVLIPCIFFLNRGEKSGSAEKISEEEKKAQRKTLLTGGICCGIALCLATNFQQIGIKYTTVGKAGFITACYIVIVPVIGLFRKKKCSPMIWLSVLLAVVGLYLLCINEQFSIRYGDILVFVCAILFSVHILIVDYFSPKVDGVKMSCIQFLVCGLLSGVVMLFTEQPQLFGVLLAWKPIAYAGIMSCGVGYTLQIVGQKGMDPTVASLILSLESCISVLSGWLLLGQTLSMREGLGCAAMFAAIILAQLPAKES